MYKGTLGVVALFLYAGAAKVVFAPPATLVNGHVVASVFLIFAAITTMFWAKATFWKGPARRPSTSSGPPLFFFTLPLWRTCAPLSHMVRW